MRNEHVVDTPEPVDLGTVGDLGNLVRAHESTPHGEIWCGPVDDNPLRMFGPGTTPGGRAEAGWRFIGTVVGPMPTMTPTPQPINREDYPQ